MRRTNRRGFTLIELLIVIAVISVLAAMVLTSLQPARRVARRMKCSHNLRQIGLGWDLYLDDTRGHFPSFASVAHYGGRAGTYPGWDDASGYGADDRVVNQYMGLEGMKPDAEVKTFECPDDCGIRGIRQTSNYYLVGTSYPCNVCWTMPEGQWVSLDSARLDEVAVPHTKLILAGDAQWGTNCKGQRWRSDWHGGWAERRANVVFLDTHAEFLRMRWRLGVYLPSGPGYTADIYEVDK